jgi:hypothetical protein
MHPKADCTNVRARDSFIVADRLGEGERNDYRAMVAKGFESHQENGVVGVVFSVRITTYWWSDYGD